MLLGILSFTVLTLWSIVDLQGYNRDPRTILSIFSYWWTVFPDPLTSNVVGAQNRGCELTSYERYLSFLSGFLMTRSCQPHEGDVWSKGLGYGDYSTSERWCACRLSVNRAVGFDLRGLGRGTRDEIWWTRNTGIHWDVHDLTPCRGRLRILVMRRLDRWSSPGVRPVNLVQWAIYEIIIKLTGSICISLRPNPCLSGSDGCAPTRTLFCFASKTVLFIIVGSLT